MANNTVQRFDQFDMHKQAHTHTRTGFSDPYPRDNVARRDRATFGHVPNVWCVRPMAIILVGADFAGHNIHVILCVWCVECTFYCKLDGLAFAALHPNVRVRVCGGRNAAANIEFVGLRV